MIRSRLTCRALAIMLASIIGAALARRIARREKAKAQRAADRVLGIQRLAEYDGELHERARRRAMETN